MLGKLEQGQWSEWDRGRDSRALGDGIGLDIHSQVYGLGELNMIKDLAGKTDGWGELSGYTVEGPCELPLKMGNENQGFRPRPRRGSARACAGRGGWEKPRLQAPRGEARALDPVLAPAPTRLARPSQDQGHLHL